MVRFQDVCLCSVAGSLYNIVSHLFTGTIDDVL